MRTIAIIVLLFSMETVSTTGVVDECVDLSAACVEKSNLCNLAAYDDLMNFYCKKTCARDCTPFTTTTTLKPCADITPDCLNKKALCSMVAFNAITTEFCPKTCGLCI